MLLLTISVLLLIAGFAATIVAFGGDTWIKGEKPFLERITARGWISIVALIVALALGMCKEVLTKSEEVAKDAQTIAREAELKADRKILQGKLDTLQGQVETTGQQLTVANQALAQARGTADFLQAELEHERTPVHTVSLNWEVEVDVTGHSQCIEDYLAEIQKKISVFPNEPTKLKLSPSGWYEYAAEDPTVSEKCQQTIRWIKTFGQLRANVRKKSSPWISLSDFKSGTRHVSQQWNFEVVGTPIDPFIGIRSSSDHTLWLTLKAALNANQMVKQDGSRVSILNLSESEAEFYPSSYLISGKRVLEVIEMTVDSWTFRFSPKIPGMRLRTKSVQVTPDATTEVFLARFPSVRRQ